ncbi:MAG: glucose-6-phosphate isomerase [Proteobacteria bacterium]|nr:glucose-6-phosphate isomerase [Pseudomonadota bacterium]
MNHAREKYWQMLEKAAHLMQTCRLSDLFTHDSQRVNKYSICVDKIYLDYSKNFLNDDILALLINLADSCDLSLAIKQLLSGACVNSTESKPALHAALRQDLDSSLQVNDVDILPLVKAQKEKMFHLVSQLHQGTYLGTTKSKITDVVNIGIGGSDLGPVMAVEALKEYRQTSIKLHFVSNIDPEMITSVLQECTPSSTLFILSSKSFTTPETLANAQVAKKWLEDKLSPTDINKHFIAVTANPEKAQTFGILPENILQFWDWVGGRYSIWSTIGLPLAISIGTSHFESFLLGARKMDEHFANAPLRQNMPVLLALIGIWYINFWQAKTLAVLPYSTRLRHFADYLQQLDMESNGKTPRVGTATGPIVWGQVGTNGQHAFFQLLHQGTHFIPVDFIAAKLSHTPFKDQHLHLLANCLAQARALMQGSEEKRELHEYMPGNKPSNMLLLEQLTPTALGQLLALYEHKVFVQGIIWGINSFDQPGVELGKKLAHTLIAGLESGAIDSKMDPSTQSLIEKIRA